MDSSIILLFTFGPFTVAMAISTRSTYDQFVSFVRLKWKELELESLSFTYRIPGYESIILDNDDDLSTMLKLVFSNGIRQVDVFVKVDKKSVFGDDNSVLSLIELPGTFDEDAETDLLPLFCPHEETRLLSADWDQGIREEGQLFQGGVKELRLVLEKFCIGVGFKLKMLKNDNRRLTCACSAEGCTWRLHALPQRETGYFYIKSLNNVHTRGACQSSNRAHVSSRLVSALVVDEVRGKAMSRPCDVKFDLKTKYGLNSRYNTTWIGVEKARSEIYGDHSLSFGQLKWYGEELLKTNPGSEFVLEYNHRTSRFRRVFVAFDACIHGFNYCRPMLFVDGTFLKGRYKGVLLTATAKDGNQGIFPLAFAVVDAENIENWNWFMNQLTKIVSPQRALTFISDRHAGIIQGVKTVFPSAAHAFCLQHLKYNLRAALTNVDKKWRERIIFRFRECAYTPSKLIFDQKIESIRKQCGKKVKEFFANLPPENWSNAYFVGHRYGEMWSNVAESYNAMILGARNLPITKMIDTLRVQVMEMFSQRRDAANGWLGVLCPEMNCRLQTAVKFGKSWHVKKSNDELYEVTSFPSVTVDIDRRTCSCCQWQLYGFPCAHAAAAIDRSGKDPNDFVECYFHVRYYRESYHKSIIPVPTVEKPDFTAANVELLPPNTKVPSGRRSKKRKRNTGEFVKRKIRCSRCGILGDHNKKSCKAAI